MSTNRLDSRRRRRRRRSRWTAPAARVVLALAAAGLFAGALVAAERSSGFSRDRFGSSSSSSSSSSRRAELRERYPALADRNMFLRDRARPQPMSRPSFTGPRDSRPPAPPEASYILTGVVLEDEYRAYVEDGARSRILRLGLGDTVARGRVVGIDLDGIAYERDGRITWVSMGQDFTGALASASPFGGRSSPSSSSPSSRSSDGPSTRPSDAAPAQPLPIDPNNPNLTFEERMRLRRQMEQARMSGGGGGGAGGGASGGAGGGGGGGDAGGRGGGDAGDGDADDGDDGDADGGER